MKSSCDWIIPGMLMVGDMYAGSNVPLLKQCHIRGIVVVRPELPMDTGIYADHEFNVLHISIYDTAETLITPYLNDTNEFIDRHLKRNLPVLVHCTQGKSRSVSVVAAYLIYKYHMSAESALNLIYTSRPIAKVNQGFAQQLKKYADSVGITRQSFFVG
jgi:dual specificity phosphatase 12